MNSFRPNTLDEVDTYYPSDFASRDTPEFLNNHNIPASGDQRRFNYSTVKWYDYGLSEYAARENFTEGQTSHLDADLINSKHTSIIVIEDTRDMSFEFEMMQHIEGAAAAKFQGLSATKTALPKGYGSAL